MYESAVGCVLQVPADAVSACPWTALPAIVGCEVETKVVPAAAIGPTSDAYVGVVAPAAVTGTVSPIVSSASAATVVYAEPVAPWTELQWAPVGSQRYHW